MHDFDFVLFVLIFILLKAHLIDAGHSFAFDFPVARAMGRQPRTFEYG